VDSHVPRGEHGHSGS